VGVPDERWGESVKAVVVVEEGQEITQKELLDFCREKMTGYKKPKSVDFVPSLPKSSLGKVLKREVKAWYSF